MTGWLLLPSLEPALHEAGQEGGPSLKKELKQAHTPLHLREGLFQAAPRGSHNLSKGAEGLAQEILHIQGTEKTSITPSAHSHPSTPSAPPLEA